VAQDAAARWADIQRRADDLAQALYAMREAAPDEDKRMRAADVLAALQAVRSAMAAERGTDVSRVPPPEQVRSRLTAFRASLEAPGGRDEGMHSGRPAPVGPAAPPAWSALLAGEHGRGLALQVDIRRAAAVDHAPLARPAGEPVRPLPRVVVGNGRAAVAP